MNHLKDFLKKVDTILVSNDAEKIYENTNFSQDGLTLFSNLNRQEISNLRKM